jgi:hypothetical protein
MKNIYLTITRTKVEFRVMLKTAAFVMVLIMGMGGRGGGANDSNI